MQKHEIMDGQYQIIENLYWPDFIGKSDEVYVSTWSINEQLIGQLLGDKGHILMGSGKEWQGTPRNILFAKKHAGNTNIFINDNLHTKFAVNVTRGFVVTGSSNFSCCWLSANNGGNNHNCDTIFYSQETVSLFLNMWRQLRQASVQLLSDAQEQAIMRHALNGLIEFENFWEIDCGEIVVNEELAPDKFRNFFKRYINRVETMYNGDKIARCVYKEAEKHYATRVTNGRA